MGNSGTGTRLFTALAALGDSPVFFDGDDSLRTRPMAPLLDALRSLGAKASSMVVSNMGIWVLESMRSHMAKVMRSNKKFAYLALSCYNIPENPSNIPF